MKVAWADGSVTTAERGAIMNAAEAHGIEPGSEAANFLVALLEKCPSDNLLQQILAILKDILTAKDLHPHTIMEACEDVAAASGGVLGLGNKISSEERRAIETIAAHLGTEPLKKLTEELA